MEGQCVYMCVYVCGYVWACVWVLGVRVCVCVRVCPVCVCVYLNGCGCYLDVVQLAQGALSVYEVGGSQLVQSLQSYAGRVARARVFAHIRLLTQLSLVHKYR